VKGVATERREDGSGDCVFVSGTGPIDPVDRGLVGDSIEQQAEQTIDNIVAMLETDRASLPAVVKVQCTSPATKGSPGEKQEINALRVQEKLGAIANPLLISGASCGPRSGYGPQRRGAAVVTGAYSR
jgi:hypothetical protein